MPEKPEEGVRGVYEAFILGLQEALFEMHGKMALALNRIAGRAMMDHIKEKGLWEITGDTTNSLAHDVRHILEELLEVGDVTAEEKDGIVELTIVNCPFSDVKRKLLNRNKVPVVCPLASVVLKATEETLDKKVKLVNIDVNENECRFEMKEVE